MPEEKTSHNTGLEAEKWAVLYLRLKGYQILEKRYRTPMGEIDIVAKRYGVLVFVEVKHRRTHEEAMDAVHRVNQERVRRAAELYLTRHIEYTVLENRFDVLVMAPGKLPQHIQGAF